MPIILAIYLLTRLHDANNSQTVYDSSIERKFHCITDEQCYREDKIMLNEFKRIMDIPSKAWEIKQQAYNIKYEEDLDD